MRLPTQIKIELHTNGNRKTTKIMELDKWQENTNIVIDNINVERVQSFQYNIYGRNVYHKWRRCFQQKTAVGDGSASAK